MKTKSQIFADAVFPRVQEVAQTQEARKYKTLCKKAGSLVRNSGLMQTIAFFKARGQRQSEAHHLTLYDHLQSELRHLQVLPNNTELIDHVRQAHLPAYMHLTRETLGLLNWHKRLVETLIAGDADHEEDVQ
ncbi:MAG TPA: type III-B CRISPR module-associated protein Cmr5 [Desulfobacteraceae bacterium]|nr:type III-B CRISPR module-associated protein Cmr5 [Desulfobacteraceae bacterium]